MTWTKQPPFAGTKHLGCLNCTDGTPDLLPMDAVVAVGFGDARITRDGETVFDEQGADDFHSLAEFEAMAATDPDHDWRCILFGPLRGREYQRHGAGQWVLIDSNGGFA